MKLLKEVFYGSAQKKIQNLANGRFSNLCYVFVARFALR
jgi:hypothetical protein